MTDKILISFESNKDLADMLENLKNHEYHFAFEVKRLDIPALKARIDRTNVKHLRKQLKELLNEN